MLWERHRILDTKSGTVTKLNLGKVRFSVNDPTCNLVDNQAKRRETRSRRSFVCIISSSTEMKRCGQPD